MANSLFDYRDYRKYLRDQLPTQGPKRGARSSLAKVMRCQTAFITQVLTGKNQLSLEHAETINEFLHHSDVESEFFLLLVQLDRAGTMALKRRVEGQVQKAIDQQEQVAQRIKKHRPLNETEQWIYYSHWVYSAIHILCSISRHAQDAHSIAAALKTDLELTRRSLQFLMQIGLIKKTSHGFGLTEKFIHVDPSSPMLIRHHLNWRNYVQRSFESPRPEALHFTAVYSMSKADYSRLRKLLLDFVESSNQLIQDSVEEVLINLNLDLHQLS